MKYLDVVLKALKPKVASFGFTKKEIESAAAVIADNLNLNENAEEEVVNAAVDKAVNTMIPVLQLAQSQASRTIERFKSERKKESEEEKEEEIDDDNGDKLPVVKKTPTPRPTKEVPPEWVNSLINTVAELREELGGLKNEKLVNSRKQRLENALKDTGVMGQQTLRDFAKMKFETDEEFDDYLAEVETSVKDFRREQSDASLKTLGKHPARGNDNNKELTDSEIDKIVGAM